MAKTTMPTPKKVVTLRDLSLKRAQDVKGTVGTSDDDPKTRVVTNHNETLLRD